MDKIKATFEPNGKGGGHLRSPRANYAARSSDPVVDRRVVQALRLRGGETVEVEPDAQGRGGRRRLTHPEQVTQIDELPVDEHIELTPFEDLTPIDPRRQIRFESPGGALSMRVVDLLTPIGFGQRGLIVAPPRTGKTFLLQHMAAGLAVNHPDVYMLVLLIDERPEEVTEMRRTVHGEVVASSNDQNIASHVRIARLMIQRAKRLVEAGRDVLVLLDSLTRLGRAFNANTQGGRRIMSGGLDINALTEPKAIFGAARNLEGGGSLTIMASCLIETGSRMDEVIFNEFKGTGNMEIILSRAMADRRIFPAIDLPQSGTRKEELLLDEQTLALSHRIRRTLVTAQPARAMEALMAELNKDPDNAATVTRLLGSLSG